MKLSDAIGKCLQHLSWTLKRSPQTVENYGRTMSQYLAYVQARGLEDDTRNFNPTVVSGFADDLCERGAAGSTVHNKLHGLASLYKYLQGKKDGRGRLLLPKNPLVGFDRPPTVKPAVKFLEPEEFKQFLATPAPEHLALARDLLVDTWIRRLEAVEANCGDLKQIGDVVYLSLAVKGRRHEGEQRVSIPLSTDFAERLWQHLQGRKPQPEDPLLIAPSPNGARRWTASQLTCAMIRLGERAGIKRLTTSPHVIRHTLATIAANNKVDRVTLAALLNHRGLAHVDRYTHLVPGATAEVRAEQRGMIESYLRRTSDSCESTLPRTQEQRGVSF